MFDLSPIAINNIKGFEKKKEYIYSTMCKKVDELLGNFDERMIGRNDAIDKLYSEAEKKAQAAKVPEQFTWLKLKDPYESLRSKLRYAIFEKLCEVQYL